MPSIIAGAIISTFSLTGIPALAVTAGIQLLSGLALSAALQPRDPRQRRTGSSGRVAAITSVGPRFKLYGRNLTAGQIVFQRVGGSGSQEGDNVVSPPEGGGYLHRIYAHGQGPITSILEIRLDGRVRTIESDGRVLAAPFVGNGNASSLLRVETRLGDVPSPYYPGVVDAAAEWTEAHRLDGLFTVYARFQQRNAENHTKSYPTGQPTKMLVLSEGAPVNDPRISLTTYSDNAALVIADWIESEDGFGLVGQIDTGDLIAAAEAAEKLRPLSSGGSVPMWRLAGRADLTAAAGDVLADMLAACGGDVFLRPDGKIGMTIGGDPDPVITLTDDDVLEFLEGDDGPDDLDRFTHLPATYVDEAMDYAETTAETWVNASELERIGYEREASIIDLSFAPSHAQARHAMKIQSARRNPPRNLRISFKISALPAIYERTVRLSLDSLGIHGVFRVSPGTLSPDLMTVTLDLAEIVGTPRAWSAAEEGLPQTLPPEPDDADAPPAAPVNVQVGGKGGGGNAGIMVVYDAPTQTGVDLYVSHSPAGADTWTAATPGETSTEITGLVADALYDIAVMTARSAVTDPDDVAATDLRILSVPALDSDPAPDAPTDLDVADLGNGVVNITATAPADTFVRRVQLLRDGVVFADIEARAGAVVQSSDTPGAGQYQYSARAVSLTGQIGASSLSVSQTIS